MVVSVNLSVKKFLPAFLLLFFVVTGAVLSGGDFSFPDDHHVLQTSSTSDSKEFFSAPNVPVSTEWDELDGALFSGKDFELQSRRVDDGTRQLRGAVSHWYGAMRCCSSRLTVPPMAMISSRGGILQQCLSSGAGQRSGLRMLPPELAWIVSAQAVRAGPERSGVAA